MCQAIAKSTGIQCKNPALHFCHLHKKYMIEYNSRNEIKNLNNSMVKKSKEITNLIIDKAELEYENELLKEEVNQMREDFNNYQFIKRFEKLKKEIRKHANTSDFNKIEFFCMQRKNHKLLKQLMGINGESGFFRHYDEMRIKRNKLSHWYN